MSLLGGLVAYFDPAAVGRVAFAQNGANTDITGGYIPNNDTVNAVPVTQIQGIPFLDYGSNNSHIVPVAQSGGPDDFSGPFSLAAWVYPGSTSWISLVSRSSSSVRQYAAFITSGNSSSVSVDGVNGLLGVSLSQATVMNAVNHIVVSCNGSDTRVFLNGGRGCGGGYGISSTAVTAASSVSGAGTGWGYDNPGGGFCPQYIGPSGIWRGRGLTEEEAGQIFTLRGAYPFGVRRMGRPLGNRIIVP